MILILLTVFFSFFLCTVSFFIIKEKTTVDVVEQNQNTTIEKECLLKKKIFHNIVNLYKDCDKKAWIILGTYVVLEFIISLRLLSLTSNLLDFFRIALVSLIIGSASIVDLYTKKIPNIYPVMLLSIRGILIVVEIIVHPSIALKSTIISVVGLLISFFILLLLKLIAKGGFGMGDVKILCTSCALAGILTTLYSFTIAMFVCMVVSIFLMVTKKKGSKDEIPFGPFIYIGYFITVMLGTLG